MKIGDRYTASQLLDEGWKMTGYLGNCQIWHKENIDILLNPDTHLVEFVC